jgi:hypothetical protein
VCIANFREDGLRWYVHEWMYTLRKCAKRPVECQHTDFRTITIAAKAGRIPSGLTLFPPNAAPISAPLVPTLTCYERDRETNEPPSLMSEIRQHEKKKGEKKAIE